MLLLSGGGWFRTQLVARGARGGSGTCFEPTSTPDGPLDGARGGAMSWDDRRKPPKNTLAPTHYYGIGGIEKETRTIATATHS